MIKPHKPITKFDFIDAVTTAFRIPGDPKFGFRLWFWMTLGMAIIYLVVLPFILPYYAGLLTINQNNMQDIMAGRTPNNDDILAVMKPAIPGYLALMFGIWAMWVSGETALYRKVLRGEEGHKQPLRLGTDEGRVLLSQLGVFGLILLVYIGGLFGVIFFTALIGAMSKILGVLVGILAVIALLCALVNFCVTLAPAAPLSTRYKTLHVFAARKIIKHRFWEIFVAYLAVYVLGYVVIYIVMYIAIIAVTGNDDIFFAMSGFGTNDPQAVFEAAGQRLKNPFFMFVAVIAQIAYAAAFSLWVITLVGIGAYAVKWWEADIDMVTPDNLEAG